MYHIMRTPYKSYSAFCLAVMIFTICIASTLAEGHTHVIEAMTVTQVITYGLQNRYLAQK